MAMPDAITYAAAGQILRNLTELSEVMARAAEAHLDRVLHLSPIERQDALAVAEARRRLSVLPDDALLSRWLRLAAETTDQVIGHEE